MGDTARNHFRAKNFKAELNLNNLLDAMGPQRASSLNVQNF